MDTFKSKWNHKSVQDDGAYMSKEAKSFCSAFCNMLKRSFPNANIEMNHGHYYISGFIQENNTCVYVSYNIPRYGRSIDFNASGCLNGGVLYRTARSTADFTGGTNNYCSLADLPKCIRLLQERQVKISA